MSIDNPSWQEKIQQLGSEEECKLLQRLRNDDPDLADALLANSIQNHLNDIGLQTAPADLQQKLYAITDDTSANKKPVKKTRQLWAAWTSVAAALMIAVILKPWHSSPQPSAMEIAQAQQELALAFHYLNRSADRTRHYTEASIAHSVQTAMSRTSFVVETEELFDL
jgi:hypothetical protein